MPTKEPKIALIHDWLTVPGGSERVLEVLHKMYPEAPIFTTIYNKKNFPQFSDAKIITSHLDKIPLAHKKYQIFIPLMPKAVESYDLSNYDIIISDSHACAKGAIKAKGAYHICYCHTPLRYVWFPDIDQRANSSWIRKKAANYLKKWDLATINRVDEYYGNSNYICQRIKTIYHRDAGTIYPPVDINKWKTSDRVGKYFLFVSRLVSHKKAEIVIEAFNRLERPLKIVGDGPELENLRKIAKPNIEFTGRISDDELKNIYSQTQALIFPSIDDFGIVPIEVMASGRPVIAINKGGASETIVEGKTGLHFENVTPEAIISAVQKFNLNNFDSSEIRQWAEKFDTSLFIDNIKKAVAKATDKLEK
ncbi:MAG: glycosyltransferase [bacterium]|nr:glycosyltransferase [bacterium]